MKNKYFTMQPLVFSSASSSLSFFTHLCTKYLCTTKSILSIIGQVMAQHQVHGALVLLYCTVIWSAIGILFSFGNRLFSRDWSMLLRATLTHFFLMLAGFVPLATLAGWFPFHWTFYLQLIIEFAIVHPHHLGYSL